MRNALGQLLLATLLLAGCEDNKLITPPPAETPTQAKPTEASPPQASPTPAAPRQHGATGVGDTAPVSELAPPKAPSVPPTTNEWGRKSGVDAGTAPDAGGSGPRGPPPGDSQGPAHPQ